MSVSFGILISVQLKVKNFQSKSLTPKFFKGGLYFQSWYFHSQLSRCLIKDMLSNSRSFCVGFSQRLIRRQSRFRSINSTQKSNFDSYFNWLIRSCLKVYISKVSLFQRLISHRKNWIVACYHSSSRESLFPTLQDRGHRAKLSNLFDRFHLL